MEYQDISFLEDELGRFQSVKPECPGVYYITAKHTGEWIPREYYVVMETSVLPQEAKAYGWKRRDLRLFPMGDEAGGWQIVQYEIGKYRIKHRLPQQEPLLDTAFFAAGRHPEYFGAYPVPVYTPRGRTVRHKALDNGIYWLETDQCQELLSVCYPIWSTELSGAAEKLGEQTAYDRKHNIHRTLGSLFFSGQSACIPIYQLLRTRPEWAGTVINKTVLLREVGKYLSGQ